jgi:hypothetical protein
MGCSSRRKVASHALMEPETERNEAEKDRNPDRPLWIKGIY